MISAPFVFPGGTRAKNRVALAPMTNPQSNPDGSLGEDELAWLEARARGGFGTVITCASHVARDGQGFPNQLGIFDDSLLPGLTRLATSLHAHGALAIAQLFHAGARALPEAVTDRWSASENDGARAATEQDIERVVDQFGAAAERAKAAGFDGVELHGAHGYLLMQFLSSTTNRRDDAWGGEHVRRRARLLREVTRVVRGRVGPPFIVGVRISPEDFQNVTADLDESLEVAQSLALEGIDYLHLSLWDAHKKSKKRPDVHPLPLFRDALGSFPIMVAGNIWTRSDAENLFSLGADLVALGRSAILNPDWPIRAEEDTWEPRRPPMSAAEFGDRAVSARFVEYLRRWKGFVSP